MTELKTMLEVAEAKERGEVIEYIADAGNYKYEQWKLWDGKCWHSTYKFRIQPKPKKTVKYCLWGNQDTGEVVFTPMNNPMEFEWKHIPGTEVEVTQDD